MQREQTPVLTGNHVLSSRLVSQAAGTASSIFPLPHLLS